MSKDQESTDTTLSLLSSIPCLSPSGSLVQRSVPPGWVAVKVTTQEEADGLIPGLLKVTARRILVVEPRGTIDLTRAGFDGRFTTNALTGEVPYRPDLPRRPKIDWLIVLGGEAPMHPSWVASLRDQSVAAGVPFALLSWGSWLPKLWLPPTSVADLASLDWGTLDVAGDWWPQTTPWNGRQGDDSDLKEYVMIRVGPERFGRMLEGREWDQRPESIDL